MANENKRHSAGDKVTVAGTVTRVGDNAGRTEYAIAIEDDGVEYNRPLNIAQSPDPLVFTNGYVEFQKELLSRSDTREDSDLAALSDDADKIREETDTPDPREKAAGNASVDVKPQAAKPVAKSSSIK